MIKKNWIFHIVFNLTILVTMISIPQGYKNSELLRAAENNSYNSSAMNNFMEGIINDLKGDYARAILEYQAAVKSDSNVPIFYLSMAEGYYYLQMDDQAAAMYEKYLELQPDDYEIGMTLLRKLYLPKGKFQSAEKLIENMLQNMQESSTLRLLLLDLYLRNNKIDKAVKNIASYLANPSVSEEIYKHIADSFAKLKKTDLGISVFKSFLNQFKDNSKLSYGLGYLYLSKSDTSQTIKLYEDAVMSNPNTAYIKEALCDIYIDSNNLQKARTLFDEVGIDTKINIADAYFFNKKDEEANILYKKIKDENDNISLIYFRLGEIKYQDKKYKEAIIDFSKAAEIEPSISETHFRLALSYFRLTDYSQSLTYIKKSLEIEPEELRFLNLKADIVYNIGDFKETEKIYNEIFKIEPEYDLALNNYSYILSERGEKLELALEMSKKAVKKRPENGSYLDTLGWIYYKLNRYEEALKYLKKASGITGQESEPRPVILDHLGDVYFKLGDIYHAKYYWRKALQVDKENENLIKKIEEN